ncbi:MAG TPA: ECF-type sigma factor [Planctomycetota bacterium]|nr:ECF-type sigma factor [Planctomycetota bacterium]
MSEPPGSPEKILARLDRGDPSASAELLPLVYTELRGLARGFMAAERPGTLQTTALVHEAYLRIAGTRGEGWNGRAHFFGAAAEAMRRILVERARARGRLRRGGDRRRLDLDTLDLAADEGAVDVIAVDEAVAKLAAKDPRSAEVVRLRFFAGLDVPEIAAVLGVAPRTVKREWVFARAWLLKELGEEA